MEQAVATALVAVKHDNTSTAQRWFELLVSSRQSVEQSGGGWTELLTKLRADWTATDVEIFQKALDDRSESPWETVGKLVELGTELPTHYAAATKPVAVQPVAVQASAPAPVDTEAWWAFLKENGQRWNGTTEAWQQFRTWFAYEATQKGFQVPAEAFLKEAEESSDKAAVFTRYSALSPAVRPVVDLAAWHAFLQENGQRWNGTTEAWQQFRTWFAYEAAQKSFQVPAEDFLKEAEEASDRIAVFTRHHALHPALAVPATPPTTEPTAAPAPTPAADLAAEPPSVAVQEMAAARETGSAQLDTIVQSELTPDELAGLSEERLAELLQAALEHAATES